MVDDKFDGLINNQIYEAEEIDLDSKISPSTHKIKVSRQDMDCWKIIDRRGYS